MKKTLLFLLLSALLLSACSGSSLIPPLPGLEDASPIPTETPAPVEPTEQLFEEPEESPVPFEIYVAYSNEGEYADGAGNTYQFLYRIPGIRDSGEDAERLSQQIYDTLFSRVKDGLDAMEGNYSLIVLWVDYSVYQNGDLYSIVSRVDTDWGFSEYYAVTYDRSTGKEVDRAALLQRYGLTEMMFLPLAADLVDGLYQSSYVSVKRDAFWKQQHDKSIAPENFTQDCQLYINESGQLCMIFRLYSLAGGDYYYHILPVAEQS